MLADFLGPSHDLYTRQDCAQLLHKLFTDEDDEDVLCSSTWHNRLSVSSQSTIKRILLDCISLEDESDYIIHELLATVLNLGKTTVPGIKGLHRIFLNTLNDDTLYLPVRVAATRAAITFIQCVPISNEKERFQDLLPGRMRTLTDALSNSDHEDAAWLMLSYFVELGKNELRFLKRLLVVVVGPMLGIVEDNEVG